MANSTALIPVSESTINQIQTLTVDARKLHEFLGVKRDFSNWIKGRIAKYDFKENQDFIIFAKSGENHQVGRPIIDYTLTINMAKELAMVENNEKGRRVRRYFIECERQAHLANQAESFRLTSPGALDALSDVASRKALNNLINTWVKFANIRHEDAWNQVNAFVNVAKAVNMTNSQVKQAIGWVQNRIDSLRSTPALAMPDAQTLVTAITTAIKKQGRSALRAYTPIQPTIYSLLQAQGSMTAAELADCSGLTRQQVDSALNRLKVKGQIAYKFEAKGKTWGIVRPFPKFDPAIVNKIEASGVMQDIAERPYYYASEKYSEIRDKIAELENYPIPSKGDIETHHFLCYFEDMARSFPDVMKHFLTLKLENLKLKAMLAKAC